MEYLTELLAEAESPYTREDIFEALETLQSITELVECVLDDDYMSIDLECKTPYSVIMNELAEILNHIDN